MKDTGSDLKDQIRLGEDSELELKAVLLKGRRIEPRQESIADELAAFANTRGGVLILGVDDKSREATGMPLDKLDSVERHVVHAAQSLVDPPLPVTTIRLELEDSAGVPRPVLRIDVAKSLFVHKSPRGYLHRIGSTKRQMPPEYLARLFQQRSQTRLVRFDEQPVVQAPIEALNRAIWERFIITRPEEEDVILLSKLGLAARDEHGLWHPTVAGVLTACDDPRQWLPNAFIQAVAYRGTAPVPEAPGKPYQLDAKDISGPVDAQVHEACLFVVRNMRVAATKHMGRLDIPQFDITAIFEAIVNAVAHRDYAIHGCKIRLHMYSDRLELYSPGPPPNTITIDTLVYRQASRNETLTSLLARCPVRSDIEWLKTARKTLMDRRGEGVPVILENSEKLSGRRPEYRLLDDTELMLTIYAANPAE